MIRVLEILEAAGGGAARHVVDLCEGLARRGVEVHLAYSPLRADFILREGLGRLKDAGVRLWELPMRRAPHPKDLSALWKLWRYLVAFPSGKHWEAGGFRLVHGHSAKGGALARLLRGMGRGVKAVYTPHAFITQSPALGGLSRRVYARAERALARATDALIAVSKAEKEEALRLGYPPERIHLIPNGIRPSLPMGDKGEIRKELGLPADIPLVGFVGRFVPQKNPLLLLEAFALAQKNPPEAALALVGEGPLEGILRAKVRAMGLEGRVFWPGAMDGRVAMRAFDVFVLSSDYEGFPYVLLEALALGLPVVSTRVGGSEELISDGAGGFLVPVGDKEALAEALSRLLSEGALRERFGKEGRKRVQAFSVGRMVEATFEVYRGLLEGGRFARDQG